MNVAVMHPSVVQAVFDGMSERLSECLDRLGEQERELELRRLHNRTLFDLLLQPDRQLQAVRAELMRVRGVLGEELR